jgi:Helix-turn-helix domain
MSIKVSTEVWRGSRHKSGNLLVLLAMADHADDQGKAWPGIPLLAHKARLSKRHTRRCLRQLLASGELEILAEPAPSGGKWYQIRLDLLTPDNLSTETSASDHRTPVSKISDAHDRRSSSPYIKESSNESSVQPRSEVNTIRSTPQHRTKEKLLPGPDATGLISQPKGGF